MVGCVNQKVLETSAENFQRDGLSKTKPFVILHVRNPSSKTSSSFLTLVKTHLPFRSPRQDMSTELTRSSDVMSPFN
jgi:hypothetical protein